MRPKNRKNRRTGEFRINLTPFIDVVLLLVIFFMLLCQFIGQENFRLVIPDDCQAVQREQDDLSGMITVSVFSAENIQGTTKGESPAGSKNSVQFAVRSQQFDTNSTDYRDNKNRLIKDMSDSITREAQFRETPVVYLRADRNLEFAEVQDALIAITRTDVHRVRLAAYPFPLRAGSEYEEKP
jgi:biopolymer transport protein ExbD